jgi:hypothetical protein
MFLCEFKLEFVCRACVQPAVAAIICRLLQSQDANCFGNGVQVSLPQLTTEKRSYGKFIPSPHTFRISTLQDKGAAMSSTINE